MKAAFKTTLDNFWISVRKARVLQGILNLSVYSGYYQAIKDYIQPLIQAAALGLPVLAYLSSEKKTAVGLGIIYFLIYLLSSMVTRQSGRFSQRFGGLGGSLNLTLVAGLTMGF